MQITPEYLAQLREREEASAVQLNPVLDFQGELSTRLTFIQEQAYILFSDNRLCKWDEAPDDVKLAPAPPKRERTHYLSLEGIERISQPIDGKSMLNALSEVVGSYALLEEHDRRMVAIWIAFTHLFPIFHHLPILFVNGPGGSGKSKLITVVEALSFNGWRVVETTTAAQKDVNSQVRGTFLHDEVEELGREVESDKARLLRNLFENDSVSIRQVKDQHGNYHYAARTLSGPQAIANISGIRNEPLLSRCVIIPMEPHKFKEKPPEPSATDEGIMNAGDDVQIWALQSFPEVRAYYNDMDNPLGLASRRLQVYSPLMAVAKAIGLDCYKQLLQDIRVSEQRLLESRLHCDDELSWLVSLSSLMDPPEWRISNRELTEALNKATGENLRPKQVALLVRSHRLSINETRTHGSVHFVLSKDRIDEAIENYSGI